MDGWELAKKILEMRPDERETCFKDCSLRSDIFELGYEKALELYTTYKETHKFGLINLGDEVKIVHPLLTSELYGLVVGLTKDNIYILPNHKYKTDKMEPVLKLMLNVQGISIERTGFITYIVKEYAKGDVR